MNEIEINELEWYFRDFLFRNYSKAVLQLKTETIPTKMIETYLRYRNADRFCRNNRWRISLAVSQMFLHMLPWKFRIKNLSKV